MIKVAVIGTGGIAGWHAADLAKIPGCSVVAACDVNKERAEDFAKRYNIPRVYGSVEELIKAGDFDAGTVATTDPSHSPVSLALLRAGKHVLCEKPLAMNYPEAAEMAAEAKKAGKINMVHFSKRNAPVIQRAHEMVKSGELGRIMHVDGSYLQCWLTSDAWGWWQTTPAWLWRLSKAHGSAGALGDLGVHMIDYTAYVVGDISSVHCRLKTFDKQVPDNRIGEYVFDANDTAVMTVEFANGALGMMDTSRWATGVANAETLAVYGDKAAIKFDLAQSHFTLQYCRVIDRKLRPWTTIDCGETPSIFDRFITSIKTGKNDQPDFAHGAAVQKVLDACLESDATDKTIRL